MPYPQRRPEHRDQPRRQMPFLFQRLPMQISRHYYNQPRIISLVEFTEPEVEGRTRPRCIVEKTDGTYDDWSWVPVDNIHCNWVIQEESVPMEDDEKLEPAAMEG